MAAPDPYAAKPASSSLSARTPTHIHPASLPSASLKLDPFRLSVSSPNIVSDKIYSGFIEHLGRGIYGGVVDNPKDPSPENLLVKQDGQGIAQGRLGWRKDVIDIIGKHGELETPIMRWPGGNFVSNYHWQDGIGPIASRPKRVELAWLSTESNIFGTDEFMDYAKELGCEPYLCLNMGTGTYEEALAWLEYCNGTGDTHWANLRRKNTGRDEPYNVKYWGLGNEMHGPWQIGHLSATDYVKQASRWAHGLRLIDPTIKLVSCGNQGNSEWDREVLMGMVGLIDLHSIHFYSMLGADILTAPGNEYEKNVFGPAAAERGIEICKSLIDLAKIERNGSLFDTTRRDVRVIEREVKIAYDEWNVWDETKAPGSVGLEQKYDYTDMLGVASWLNVLVRKHEDIGLACIAQSVNVISPLMTSPAGILFQTTYFPLRLFAKYMKGGKLLDLGFQSPLYDGPTYPEWVRHLAKPTYIDIVALLVENENGASIRVSVLNRHPSADWTGEVSLPGFKVQKAQVHSLYSEDLEAINTFESPDTVQPKVEDFDGSTWNKHSNWTARKHSWTFFIFDGVLEL